MREFDKRMGKAYKRLDLKPGDIFESCFYHPVLCLGVDYKQDLIWGISLVDGSYPHSCSLVHCGIKKLSRRQAWTLRVRGPADPEVRNAIAQEKRWWNANPEWDSWRLTLVKPRVPSPRKDE